MNKNETIADIRKEAEARFREFCEKHIHDCCGQLHAMQQFNQVFDRIEAAHEREMSKIASKNGADFGQLGNAACNALAVVLAVAALALLAWCCVSDVPHIFKWSGVRGQEATDESI